jgi:16S rRNA (guanine527-N7)-methyltransferase
MPVDERPSHKLLSQFLTTLSPASTKNPQSEWETTPFTMTPLMDQAAIAKLLEPFLSETLSSAQLNNISTYIDILLRWNARINLTAIRQPEEIVTRHFGESLFAARHLAPMLAETQSLIDIGSGAGFPGIPIKLFAPEISLTLIESNHKKATFLREVIRTLDLHDATVFTGRAEDFPTPLENNVVTLRAVEHFAEILPTALRLAAPAGYIALLIGGNQVETAQLVLERLVWVPQIVVPMSFNTALFIGKVGNK